MTDQQLVEKLKQGEKSAFEQMVKRYEKKLFVFAKSWVRSDFDAQEIVSDAFMSIFKTRDRVDATKSFSSYLYKIVKNFSISCLRKKKTHATVELFENVVSEKEDVWEKLFNRDKKEKVKEAINKLKPVQKSAVILFYFDDLAYEEIAETLMIPVNTVRTILRRAKIFLYSELNRDLAYLYV